MFLIVNPSGKYWDGFGWSEKGRAFFTVASATRSLHENGEDWEEEMVLCLEDEK